MTPPSGVSLARLHPHESSVVHLLWFAAALLFAVGLFAPLMTLSKFFLVENTVSLALGLKQLAEEGHTLIFVILMIFSVVVPTGKLILLVLFWNRRFAERQKLDRYITLIAHHGKWGMLDVFVVALLVVAVKLKGLASVQIHYGLYAFAVSVLITMLLTAWMVHLSKRHSVM